MANGTYKSTKYQVKHICTIVSRNRYNFIKYCIINHKIIPPLFYLASNLNTSCAYVFNMQSLTFICPNNIASNQ